MGLAWLALSANLGHPEAQIAEAIDHLGAHEDIKVTKRSAIMRTRAHKKAKLASTLNKVIEVETALKPRALLQTCLDIEDAMGRDRKQVWGALNIDIDMIAFDRIEIKTANLCLPHPYAHTRPEVIGPLREIAPQAADWVMAVGNKPR